ncbi:hypothetical protein NYE67_10860 [Solibacillus sp. FSL W8-0474]|uniref:hypothetical protein n=1 Tax=Solibacillus sp. FSL W8-0474 TaxID=2975336 RepID=UPI0030F52124
MARGVRTSTSQLKMKVSKAEKAAREEAEQLVVTNATIPKMNEVVKANPTMRKLFNQLKKLNEYYTEADSISLNTLAFYIWLKSNNEAELLKLTILDDNYERFLFRLEKINKQINESMKQLCIPLTARFRLANDMAKVMIEEKKLEQMQAEKLQPVNPLWAVLEATEDF